MKVKPPDCFILPPEFIYTDEFHLTLFSDDYKEYKRPNEYLFQRIIKRVKLLKRSNAKGFCQSIYGIHMFPLCKRTNHSYRQSLCQALLYLDGAPELPLQFIDTNCLDLLSDKYHLVSDYIIFGTMFILISSRKCASF